MSKFKRGDKAKLLVDRYGVKAGTIVTITTRDSRHPWFDGKAVGAEYNECCITEKELQLIQENTMKYKQGDVLVDKDRFRKKVLGVCGEVYLMSNTDDFNVYDSGWTEKELDDEGFKLKTPESETIEINGKKYDRAAVTERLEELDEVA